MMGVDKIGKILRDHYREDRSIKRNSRDLSVSRATARKVLRSEVTGFINGCWTQPRPKIGPWQSKLEVMLFRNASCPKRERMTLMRISEDLQALGYEGGYDAVRRRASRLRSHEDAVLGGTA